MTDSRDVEIEVMRDYLDQIRIICNEDKKLDILTRIYELAGYALDERCSDCGAGDEGNHSWSCKLGLHPDKKPREERTEDWTGKPCPECKGHGVDKWGEDCSDCAGTGDEWGVIEPAENCPSCGVPGVTESMEDQNVPYGLDGGHVIVNVPTMRCHNEDCMFTFTDYRSEVLRQNAVEAAILRDEV